ncbi:MAG: SDR family oxidoreductase [Myxococcota bacterium]
MESLPIGYKAIVIGATGGIGGALVEALRTDARSGEVLALSRSSVPGIDFDDEAAIEAAAHALGDQGPFHLIVDATGVLEGEGAFPEKALRQLTPEGLARAFQVNAIGPALLLKHLHGLLPRKGKSVFATLSARVGSIGDNRLGGWYGYRASKAALNQFLRTASIEIARRRKDAVCLALHPGTVHTRLSEDYVARTKHEVFSPDQSARLMLQVIDQCDARQTGSHLAYDGSVVPW